MDLPGSSWLASGLAMACVAAAVSAPPVSPSAAAQAVAVELTSVTQPLDLLDSASTSLVLPSAAVPDASLSTSLLDAEITGLAPPASAISDGIIGVYLTLEQWVQYGVDLLSWAIRWVPFGGLLAAQLNMFYDLGESIVRSMVFNTAYFLDGTVGLGEALSNIGSATTTAFDTFVNDQLAWLHGLFPPLPPLAASVVDSFPDPGVLAGLTDSEQILASLLF